MLIERFTKTLVVMAVPINLILTKFTKIYAIHLIQIYLGGTHLGFFRVTILIAIQLAQLSIYLLSRHNHRSEVLIQVNTALIFQYRSCQVGHINIM